MRTMTINLEFHANFFYCKQPVYVQHFKCNIKDIRSGFPAIHRWLRMLYWDVPAFGETTQFEHIKKHYTKSHKQINPYVSDLHA